MHRHTNSNVCNDIYMYLLIYTMQSSDVYEEEEDDENVFDFNPFDASTPFVKTTTAHILATTVLVLVGFHTLFL